MDGAYDWHMLTYWFCFLRSIRFRTTGDKKTFKRTVQYYICAAIILHNFLTGWDDNSFGWSGDSIDMQITDNRNKLLPDKDLEHGGLSATK